MSTKYLILGHKNCTDGYLSLFLFWKAFKKNIPNYKTSCEFVEVQYGDVPPNSDGKHVFVLDFSYSPADMKKYFEYAASLVTLDHHLSAYQDHVIHADTLIFPNLPLHVNERNNVLASKPFVGKKPFTYRSICNTGCTVLFSKEQSGCGMALEYLDDEFGITPVWSETDQEYLRLTHWVERIEDRDLWRFKYEDTKCIYELLNSVPKTFEAWDVLLNSDKATYDSLVEVSKTRVLMRTEFARNIAALAEPVLIHGFHGAAVNAPHFLASEIGSILAEEFPFAVVYSLNSVNAYLSFRSKEDTGVDVSALAKRFQGGGHRAAAGAMLDTNRFSSLLKMWVRRVPGEIEKPKELTNE